MILGLVSLASVKLLGPVWGRAGTWTMNPQSLHAAPHHLLPHPTPQRGRSLSLQRGPGPRPDDLMCRAFVTKLGGEGTSWPGILPFGSILPYCPFLLFCDHDLCNCREPSKPLQGPLDALVWGQLLPQLCGPLLVTTHHPRLQGCESWSRWGFPGEVNKIGWEGRREKWASGQGWREGRA